MTDKEKKELAEKLLKELEENGWRVFVGSNLVVTCSKRNCL